jgi:hypothetical protein
MTRESMIIQIQEDDNNGILYSTFPDNPHGFSLKGYKG